MAIKFHYTHVLKSLKDGNFYFGSTRDLKRRLAEHQRGENISTSKRLPVELIFYEAYRNREDAERREKYFKTTKGKVTLRQMLKNFLEKR